MIEHVLLVLVQRTNLIIDSKISQCVCLFLLITDVLMSYLSTDDDNRIILKSFGNYENDYINASPIDVSLTHYILYNIDIICYTNRAFFVLKNFLLSKVEQFINNFNMYSNEIYFVRSNDKNIN